MLGVGKLYQEVVEQDRLTEIKAALVACASGASYTIDDITYTRQSVQALKTLESMTIRQLQDLEASTAGGRQGVRVPTWH